MKKLVLILLLGIFPAFAQGLCLGERKEQLDAFETRLTLCDDSLGDMSDEDKMIAAYKKGVRCVKEVMDDVFDTYYPDDAASSKNLFLQYIYDTYHIQEHLIRGSRWGRYVRNAPMYYADVERETYQIIYNLSRTYLKEIRLACGDIDEAGIRQIEGVEEPVD